MKYRFLLTESFNILFHFPQITDILILSVHVQNKKVQKGVKSTD